MKIVLQELKERRLVQIGVSYIAIGWIALEVSDQFADRGILPELVYKVVLIWFLFGIPAALLIGWHHGEKGRQRAPLSELSLLIMLAVMALGMSVSTVSRERSLREFAAAAENPLEMRRVAVTYFTDDTPDGEYQYLADGLTEDLIVELSQVQGLSVISRNGVLTFRGADVTPDSVARVLGAGTIVEGSLDRRADRLRAHLRLIEGRSGVVFRRATLDLGTGEGLAARDSVAQATARLLREWLGEEVRVRVAAASTRSTAAWALLQRGEKAWKDADAAMFEGRMDDAAALFETADSLLAQAEQQDADWPEPSTARAELTYRRARLAQRDPVEAVRLVDVGVAHANEALRRSNTAARAYELRGTLNYYRFLLRVEQDPRAEEALFQSARTDLETAIRFDPMLPNAQANLSHLYFTGADNEAGVIAAQRAYEIDMYLESAQLVLWRLFNGTLEQGSFARARAWCDEGRRRFPDDFRLASCDLRLMTTPAVDRPDIDAAWAAVERVDSLSPPNRREGQRVRSEMAAAGVIARVARARSNDVLMDSARTVLTRASDAVTPALDPNRETLPIAAYSWLLIGDADRAIRLLQQHAANDPQAYVTDRGEASWWWRQIQNDPRFRALTGRS